MFCKKGVLICQEGLSLLLPFSCHQNRSIFPGGEIYVRTPMDFPGESCSRFPRKTLHFRNSSKISRKPNHLQNRCDFPRKPNMPIFPEQLNLTGRWDNTITGAFSPGRWNNIRTAQFFPGRWNNTRTAQFSQEVPIARTAHFHRRAEIS